MAHHPIEPPHISVDSGKAWTDNRPEPAHWLTFSSGQPAEALVGRILESLAVSPREGKASILGVRTRDGFVFRMKLGRKQVAAEARLTPWEGGTQLHVTLPDVKLSEARLQECAARLQSLLGDAAVQTGAAPR